MPKKPQIDRIVQFSHEPPSEPLAISNEEVFDQLYGTKASSLFLGRFTPRRITDLFEEYGIFDTLREKGLWPVELEMRAPEQFRYYMRLTLKSGELVGELLIREGRFTPKKRYVKSVE
ncbi:MAG TPA: hypothetical protein ENF73_02580, partial [Proteobacteria bacterium]|nr:hypothetical protein [Pseudomonadota bacterium]